MHIMLAFDQAQIDTVGRMHSGHRAGSHTGHPAAPDVVRDVTRQSVGQTILCRITAAIFDGQANDCHAPVLRRIRCRAWCLQLSSHAEPTTSAARQLQDAPSERQITLRIGINVGDIIHERDGIFGDGVNIAARLETLSPPGGICISRSTYEQVHDKLPLHFADLGENDLADALRAADRALRRCRVWLPCRPCLTGYAAPACRSNDSHGLLPALAPDPRPTVPERSSSGSEGDWQSSSDCIIPAPAPVVSPVRSVASCTAYASSSAVCTCAARSAGKRPGSPRAMPHSVATPSTRA